MRKLARFIRARLSRVIFAWLAITIVTSSVLVGLAFTTYVLAGGEFRWKAHQGEAFVANRLEANWDDHEARSDFIKAISKELGFQVILTAPDGKVLDRAGPTDCHKRNYPVEIYRGNELLGVATICDPSLKGKTGFLLTLLFFTLVLWGGSGLVASRIARPLRNLTQAAEAFGGGDLQARAPALDDESELAQLSDAFNGMATQIGAQIEEHRALLAEVSHELRTPLGHLQLLVELLRTDGDNQKHLDGIAVEVDAIDFLVDQLLARSRLEFDMERAEVLEPVDLAVAAVESLDLDIELLEVIDAAPIPGDAMLLHSALTNVLRNAQIHGEGVVAFRVSKSNGHVLFEIDDAGLGRADDLELLIAPFTRGDSDSTGLGLGLALVRRIVDAHGGELLIKDRESGVTVGFRLPTVD